MQTNDMLKWSYRTGREAAFPAPPSCSHFFFFCFHIWFYFYFYFYFYFDFCFYFSFLLLSGSPVSPCLFLVIFFSFSRFLFPQFPVFRFFLVFYISLRTSLRIVSCIISYITHPPHVFLSKANWKTTPDGIYYRQSPLRFCRKEVQK